MQIKAVTCMATMLAVLAACSGDRNVRFEKQLAQIRGEFTPRLAAAVDRSERRAVREQYQTRLSALAESVEPARLDDASRVHYAQVLLDLDRPAEAEPLLAPLATHADTDIRVSALTGLMSAAAERGDGSAVREYFTALKEARGGDLAPQAVLLLETGNRLRDTDLELALELIDLGLSYPIPESADRALSTAIHIRFVDGGLGNRERGEFLDRMFREYGDREDIADQISRKREFLQFLGTQAPELDQPGSWLNREGALPLADLRGRYVLLDFFAPWCPDCRHSLPGFLELQRELKDRLTGILITRLYGFYADDVTKPRRNLSPQEEISALAAFLKRKKVTLPVFVAEDEETHNRFAASAIPHYVLIAPDGTVADLCMERVHGFFQRVKTRVMPEP